MKLGNAWMNQDWCFRETGGGFKTVTLGFDALGQRLFSSVIVEGEEVHGCGVHDYNVEDIYHRCSVVRKTFHGPAESPAAALVAARNIALLQALEFFSDQISAVQENYRDGVVPTEETWQSLYVGYHDKIKVAEYLVRVDEEKKVREETIKQIKIRIGEALRNLPGIEPLPRKMEDEEALAAVAAVLHATVAPGAMVIRGPIGPVDILSGSRTCSHSTHDGSTRHVIFFDGKSEEIESAPRAPEDHSNQYHRGCPVGPGKYRVEGGSYLVVATSWEAARGEGNREIRKVYINSDVDFLSPHLRMEGF